ncbi:hypothetical protein PHLGIDRAFT_34091 [Phlebiopsis gigantea 11061_1 CR5-6]|uniref:Uncharacterized protein n=1 Tax=Phlebiopsis gigantea (strain 11061_1 CR5-6) TaxID=745531 RepID=A0A0C3PRR0_PHLG1|nr:hypothetical protein PHLGIDRAFT_34091 [Phlebiopsis gigantea 11061_1 CR5-6]
MPHISLKNLTAISSLRPAFGPGSGINFGFTVVALVIGVLMARILFSLQRKLNRAYDDRRAIKRASRGRRRATQRTARKAQKAAVDRKMSMEAQANWTALRNYATLAVSLHRYDTASLFTPLRYSSHSS